MQELKRRKPLKGEATHEDWLALPENPPYELIEGELVMAAAPMPPHFWVVEFIYTELVLIDPRQPLGRRCRDGIGVRLDESKNTYIPDMFFFNSANPMETEEGNLYGVPDFVLEVWNGNYKKRERRKKLEVYQRLEVKEYWEVFTHERRVSIRQHPDYSPVDYLEGQEMKIESSEIPGLQIDIDGMFEFVQQMIVKRQ